MHRPPAESPRKLWDVLVEISNLRLAGFSEARSEVGVMGKQTPKNVSDPMFLKTPPISASQSCFQTRLEFRVNPTVVSKVDINYKWVPKVVSKLEGRFKVGPVAIY